MQPRVILRQYPRCTLETDKFIDLFREEAFIELIKPNKYTKLLDVGTGTGTGTGNGIVYFE